MLFTFGLKNKVGFEKWSKTFYQSSVKPNFVHQFEDYHEEILLL
jgi:hypothetical protein